MKKVFLMKQCLLMFGLLLVLATSCEPYEDFIKDFDTTTVYFASQKPLRTIVAYEDMQFKVGVALGGKRSNDTDEYANFVIDPSLLSDVDGASGFTLLPESYYTLSNANKMIIPKGKFIGDITVTLNRELFTTDADATTNTYALPLRITESSLDSIGGIGPDGNILPSPKDHTILVVKYISPYHGTYYHKGAQKELDASGAVVNEVTYNNADLVKNQTWDLKTIDRNSVITPGVGANTNEKFIMNIDETTSTVSFELAPGSNVTDFSGTGTYNSVTRAFNIEYSYTLNGKDFEVIDSLIIRRPPEQDLAFEEW
ncbi:DUF1735 domain-containing protein [Algibacter amylolyticus]|uniref:DUF1735 domain-containing protein n=1 Tax=Algibacter amylolyticus TaxID=1608400 RepID=A0A5M7B6F9_9FLAO|nr:DUF1735 domain-containing protein [Algibacter amylolyticus]KAA5825133.1 DUF1735 domain-containing protein [Algibacter amylolyticus]MBB5268759.1 hypothetical protein [Algibacter amylolyticus]TSJ77627.1 DUF1735 domain-containing protein [Algibacter amylolyticus]